MPFTPFHFGPGALMKSAAHKYFSFSLFVFTQILIDTETLYFIFKDEFPLHRLLHTYLGANIAVLIAVIAGRPLCQSILRLWDAGMKISLPSACISAMLGAYSHVFLDSIMHPDMRPFRPFSDANPLFRILDLSLLHQFCVWTGLVGMGILAVVWLKSKFK